MPPFFLFFLEVPQPDGPWIFESVKVPWALAFLINSLSDPESLDELLSSSLLTSERSRISAKVMSPAFSIFRILLASSNFFLTSAFSRFNYILTLFWSYFKCTIFSAFYTILTFFSLTVEFKVKTSYCLLLNLFSISLCSFSIFCNSLFLRANAAYLLFSRSLNFCFSRLTRFSASSTLFLYSVTSALILPILTSARSTSPSSLILSMFNASFSSESSWTRAWRSLYRRVRSSSRLQSIPLSVVLTFLKYL